MRTRNVSNRNCIFLVVLLVGWAVCPAVGQSCPSQWLSSQGLSGPNGVIYAATVWDPDGAGPEPELLVVGGDFTEVGPLSAGYVAAWDGSAWQSLGTGLSARVYALTVWGGKLIAGGDFLVAGTQTANRVAAWDGSTWEPVGKGVNSTVRALTVYNDDLYAGGWFTTSGGVSVKSIARWDGSAWQPVGGGMNSAVTALAVKGNDLVAGGWFTSAGGTAANYVARWDGSGWYPLGTGASAHLNALAVYKDDVIAGGNFTSAGGTSAGRIARWDGSNWQPLGSGTNQEVEVLTVYGDDLIAGGDFTLAGGVGANHVARWNGSNWQPLGDGTNGAVLALTEYRGDLIVGGQFSSAGGQDVINWARWGCSCIPPAITEQPVSQSVAAGEPVVFIVAATGTEPLSYQWRKDGVALADGGGISGATTATLTISAAAMADAGLYDVVVTNDCGTATSDAAGLAVRTASSALIDIRPGDCPNPIVVNLRSNGRLPVAIVGTSDFDVTQIDAATISLNGQVLPVHVAEAEDVTSPTDTAGCACAESGADGIADLVVHFLLQDVIEALDLQSMAHGTQVPVTVEGYLFDGRRFAGTDCLTVKVLKKSKARK